MHEYLGFSRMAYGCYDDIKGENSLPAPIFLDKEYYEVADTAQYLLNTQFGTMRTLNTVQPAGKEVLSRISELPLPSYRVGPRARYNIVSTLVG